MTRRKRWPAGAAWAMTLRSEVVEIVSTRDRCGTVLIRHFDDCSADGLECWFHPSDYLYPLTPLAREMLRVRGDE